jgi:hypothetical protein
MITLEYNHTSGMAFADCMVSNVVLHMVYCQEQGRSYDVCTCTGNLIEAALTAIAEGALNHEQVRFVYETVYIYPNEYGAILDWPHGFADYSIRSAERRLAAQARRRGFSVAQRSR